MLFLSHEPANDEQSIIKGEDSLIQQIGWRIQRLRYSLKIVHSALFAGSW